VSARWLRIGASSEVRDDIARIRDHKIQWRFDPKNQSGRLFSASSTRWHLASTTRRSDSSPGGSGDFDESWCVHAMSRSASIRPSHSLRQFQLTMFWSARRRRPASGEASSALQFEFLAPPR
jgi:hypothetical protein